MLKSKAFPIEKIYVPTKRRQTLDVEKVRQIAESMLQKVRTRPLWCVRMASVSSWLRGFTGWKLVGPFESWATWCRPGSTDAPRCSHLGARPRTT